jgi:hypothetical protein
MPEVTPPDELPMLSELEKLDIKRAAINFANRYNMRYRDYGGYIALEIPRYDTKKIMEGEINDEVHPTKHQGHRTKKSS